MATFIVMATTVFSTDRLAVDEPGQAPARKAMPRTETQDEAIAIALQVAPVGSHPQKPAAAATNPVVDAAQRTDPTTAAVCGARWNCGPGLGSPTTTLLTPRLSAKSVNRAMA
jgi:hypothetical protein